MKRNLGEYSEEDFMNEPKNDGGQVKMKSQDSDSHPTPDVRLAKLEAENTALKDKLQTAREALQAIYELDGDLSYRFVDAKKRAYKVLALTATDACKASVETHKL